MAGNSLALAAALALLASTAVAQTSGRLRGTITSIDGGTLKVTPNGGGPEATLSPSANTTVLALVPAKLTDIAPGAFIGTAADTQPDGTLIAREVHIFPESMRGSGEGHRSFDLGPKSSMTNGTVGQEVTAANGDSLTVSYKGGEKTILVPPTAPVVMFAPGDRVMLVPGAHIQAQVKPGSGSTLTADRIIVGKDGLVPPM